MDKALGTNEVNVDMEATNAFRICFYSMYYFHIFSSKGPFVLLSHFQLMDFHPQSIAMPSVSQKPGMEL